MSLSQEEFKRLYEQHYDGVYNFFCNRERNKGVAAELAQETFLNVYEARKSFQGRAKTTTWLFGIARNVWLNHVRDSQRLKRQAHEVPYDEEPKEDAPRLPAEAISSREPSPLDDAIGNERGDDLRQAIEELPREQREPLLLQMDQNLQYDQIAEALKISPDLVKSRLYQARQKLEAALKPHSGPNGYSVHKGAP